MVEVRATCVQSPQIPRKCPPIFSSKYSRFETILPTENRLPFIANFAFRMQGEEVYSAVEDVDMEADEEGTNDTGHFDFDIAEEEMG